MVFYRKYRPQNIEELDSGEIRNKLYSALKNPSLTPHAFLFTGPKGLGKTSAARIVAKAINCEKVSKGEQEASKVSRGKSTPSDTSDTSDTFAAFGTSGVEPCNKCDQCKSITGGSNLDVLEIDAASNRGIDEIRDLREKIRLLPARASKKVYIIDEVHMLTTEAFNALLKTLEEPPLHAVFILCTTEPHKIPETIISRCFHVPFKLASEEELTRSFKRIAKDEGLKIDDGALQYLSSLSGGSFRDGVKILDELSLSLKDEERKITKEIIEEKYQISNIKYQIEEMLECLKNKDVKNGLKLIGELISRGVDVKYFLEQIINKLHSLLLLQVGITNSEVKIQNSELNLEFKIEEIKELIELFSKAHSEMKYAVLEQLPLEMAVIEYCGQTQNCAEQNTRLQLSEAAADGGQAELRGNEVQEKVKGEVRPGRNHPEGETDEPLNQDLLKKLIDHVKTQNQSLAGVLRGCSIKKANEKEFIIEAGYKFHKEKLEEEKAFPILEKAVEDICGKKVNVLVRLKDK